MPTYSTKPVKRSKKTTPHSAVIVGGIVLAVILVVGGVALFASHRKNQAQVTLSASKGSTANNNARLPAQASNPSSSSSSSGEAPAKAPETPAPAQGAAPKTPFGDFVSNHKPSLTDTSWGTTESSVCNTSPGATCEVTFAKDGSTKSLGKKTADSNGAVYWDGWTLQGVGLTAGDWVVSATATLNNQTSSASDKLQVQP